MQADAHPDRHGHCSPEEQQRLADHASEITDAYAILRAPHRRAVHLLELHGVPLAEGTSGDILGPEFLMHVLEVREELEEAREQPPQLQALSAANEEAMSELHADLQAAFDVANDLDAARALTARLQYLQRIEDEIRAHLPVK